MIAGMSEPTTPALRPHHGYRSWTSTWWDDQGHRRTKRFGREGDVSEAAAAVAYQRWMESEYGAKAHVRNPDDPTTYTVAILAEAYKLYARTIYRKDGEVTSHITQVDGAMDAMAAAYGDRLASAMDNPMVARLRDSMVTRSDGRVLGIKTVNGRLAIVKQAVTWAREKNLVPAQVMLDVLAVKRLRPGRCAAVPTKKVKPAPEATIAAVRSKLPPVVQAMVDLQILTGMRPGEVCGMRACDVEKRKGGWVYRPRTHKTEHHDKVREIPLGPKAREIVAPFVAAASSPAEHLFSPAAAQAERRAERTANRKTPASCGNTVGSNVVRRPKRAPGDHYTNQSYRKALRHAARAVEKETGETFAGFHPHQLRHNYATKVRAAFDRETVRDTLGHSSTHLVDVYAEETLKRVAKVARRIG